jgi:hypothetical protein
MQMIAQHEAAIALLQVVRGGGIGSEPVVGWIVVAKFEGRGLRVEADEAALTAFDDAEDFVGGGVEAIAGVE